MTLTRFSLRPRLAALPVATGLLVLFECAVLACIAHVATLRVPYVVYGINVAADIAVAIHIAVRMIRHQPG
jgi:hypothetical protein